MCGNKAEDGGANPTVWLAACHPHIFSEPHWRDVHTRCVYDRWALSWTHRLSYLILTSQEGLFSLVRSAAGNFPKDTHLQFLRNAEVIRGLVCFHPWLHLQATECTLYKDILNPSPNEWVPTSRQTQQQKLPRAPASVAHSDCSPALPSHAPARQKQNS